MGEEVRAGGFLWMLESYADCYSEQSAHTNDAHLANRVCYRRTILDALRKGTHIVVDRYAHSGVAFSSGAWWGPSPLRFKVPAGSIV